MKRTDLKPRWFSGDLGTRMITMPLIRALIIVGATLAGSPLLAQAIKTQTTPLSPTNTSPMESSVNMQTDNQDTEPQDSPEMRLTIGSAIEYQADSENTEYNLPFFLEYGLTENLTVLIEPSYKFFHSKTNGSANGLGDLATSLTYEFMGETKHLPALALQGGVKWPTADNDLGTGETDYTLGAIARKTFGHVDLDVRAIYTFVGNPPGADLTDTLQGSLALEWHVSPYIDVMGEILTSSGPVNGFGGQSGSVGGFGGSHESADSSEAGGQETEGTIGLAEHISKKLKLVQEVTVHSDGTWQGMFGWEWDFGAASTSLHRWSSDPID